MTDQAVVVAFAAGGFSLLTAAVSGIIATRIARSNARSALDNEIRKIKTQLDEQQAIEERDELITLRQKYLTPLRYHAEALSGRFGELAEKLDSNGGPELRGWFTTIKDHVARDRRQDDYEAWCYYVGIFSVTTVYYTCSYFYDAREIRFNRPFSSARPEFSAELERRLKVVSDTFAWHDGEGGIWDAAQELIGERFSRNGTKMTYADMCEEHGADESVRRAVFFRTLDFYRDILITSTKARAIKSVLDDLLAFMYANDPLLDLERPGRYGLASNAAGVRSAIEG